MCGFIVLASFIVCVLILEDHIFYMCVVHLCSSCECSQANLSTSALCHILRIAGTKRPAAFPFRSLRPAVITLKSQSSDHALSAKLSSTSRLSSRGGGPSPAHVEPKLHRKRSMTNVRGPATPSSAGRQLQMLASSTKEQTLIAQLIISIIGARIPDKVHSTCINLTEIFKFTKSS
jgi:hypothetical protein